MNRAGFIFILGMLIFSIAGIGQQQKIDSLQRVIASAKEDSVKVLALIELSKQFKGKDTSRIYLEQARELAEKINFPKGIALAYKNIGITYYDKNKDNLVLENWNKSLEIYKAIKDSAGEANMLSNIGAVYMNQGADVKAIEYYMSSLAIAEKINDKLRIATVLNNTGSVYMHKESSKQKALQYYLRSLPISEELKDKNAIGTTSANIGEIYIEAGKSDSAIYFLNKSLDAHVNTQKVAQPLNDLGAVYDSLKQYSKSLYYYKMADSISSAYDNVRFQIIAQTGIADVYYKSKDLNRSLEAYKKVEKLAEVSQQNFLLKYIYAGLSKVYEAKNQMENAFEYQKKLTELKDNLYNIEAEDNMRSIVFDFDMQKKQSEINLLTKDKALADLELNRQKFAKNALIAGLGLVSLIIFILYRDYLNKAKTNKLLDSQKAQIQNLLSNILPDEVAEELQRDGTATPRFYESASVLFTDFKSFTKHADHMTPQEVIAELNSCFIAFDDIMEKYNLEKIKTIGDAYMCAGGIPVPDPNHYWNMIKAAKDIQATILKRNREREAKDLPPWEIRIGIHVGPIVAGVVGKKKYAYDIWGSTVNIASRMESNGEPGQINISSATYELIKEEYECTHRGKIYAKNVGDIDMYFLGDKIKKEEVVKENRPILVG